MRSYGTMCNICIKVPSICLLVMLQVQVDNCCLFSQNKIFLITMFRLHLRPVNLQGRTPTHIVKRTSLKAQSRPAFFTFMRAEWGCPSDL